MKYFLIYWHQKPGRLSGCDLVYASDKRQARKIYQQYHYSPIDKIISRNEAPELFEGITSREFLKARRTGICDLEAGT